MAPPGTESIRVATNRIQLLARQQPFGFVAYGPISQHSDDSADHADYYAPASSMATMPGAAIANSPPAAVCPRRRTGPRIQADSAGDPPRQSNTTCSGYLSEVHTPTIDSSMSLSNLGTPQIGFAKLLARVDVQSQILDTDQKPREHCRTVRVSCEDHSVAV